MKHIRTVLISILLSLLPMVIWAEGLFPYTIAGEIPTITHKQQRYSITFSITSVLPTMVPFTVALKQVNSSDFSLDNQCDHKLDAGKSCTITVTLDAKKMGPASATLAVELEMFPVLSHTLSTTINDVLGHFKFKASDGGGVLTSLNLKGGDNKTIYLENIGGTMISQLNVMVPERLKAYFPSGTCLDAKVLASRSNCTLTYSIPKVVEAASGVLKVSGNDVDNNPIALPVTVSALGHFVFKTSDGNGVLTSLNLKGGATGSIRLENSGSMTIDDLHLTLPDRIKTYFKGNCLDGPRSLVVGTYCTLTYNIPTVAQATSGSLQVNGSNVDNTPSRLPVTLSALGHFVFTASDGKTNLSSLAVKGGDTGIIHLKNTYPFNTSRIIKIQRSG